MFTEVFFMDINFKNIVIIIIASSIIGIAYNYLNPKGITLIKTERILQFEDENSGLDNFDTIQQNLNINDDEIEKIDSENNPELKKPSVDVPSAFDTPVAIKLARAYELFNSGVKFIDARPVEEFAEGHIKDAVNIPFYQSEQYEDVLSKINKDEILVTYCSGEDCDLSIMLGDELFEKGYTKVYIFFGGWNDWLDAGYPIESTK